MNTKYKKAKNLYTAMLGSGMLNFMIVVTQLFVNSETLAYSILDLAGSIIWLVFILLAFLIFFDLVEDHIERLKQQEQQEQE